MDGGAFKGKKLDTAVFEKVRLFVRRDSDRGINEMYLPCQIDVLGTNWTAVRADARYKGRVETSLGRDGRETDITSLATVLNLHRFSP